MSARPYSVALNVVSGYPALAFGATLSDFLCDTYNCPVGSHIGGGMRIAPMAANAVS